jgi:adenylyltransferase/sulfurtransferase
VISDYDRVELSNLQRQIIHRHADIGELKAHSASKNLHSVNPDLKITAIDWELDEDELLARIAQADVVLDCSDNFETRHLINKVCVEARKPLVSGAAIGFDGQIAVFDSRDKSAACYRCLYPDMAEEGVSCAENGVLSPVVGVVGAMQALEAIKLIAGVGVSLAGVLLIFDALRADWRRLKLNKDARCPVCAETSL